MSTGEAGGIGLVDAVAIQVGLIVGAGVFAVTGTATGIAGTAVFLSYGMAFAIVALSLVPTVVLAGTYPVTGGNYRYPSRLWSPAAAFLAAWGMSISLLGGGLPLYALSFGEYLSGLVAVDPRPIGVAVLSAFFVLNVLGIDLAARVQTLLLATLLVALGAFVAFGVPAVDAGNLTPLFPTGGGGVLVGAALLYFVCLGANFLVDLGGDVRSAAVTIPRSFLVSVPLVAALYVLSSFVAVGTVGWEALAGETLALAAGEFLSGGLETFFVVGGALFAIATTMNAVLMIAPKYLQVLAEDGLFPPQVAATNDRFGSQHWGLAVLYVVSLVVLVSPLPLANFGFLMAFGSVLVVVPVMVAAVRMVRHRPGDCADAPLGTRHRLVVGCAVAAVVANVALIGLLAAESPWLFAGWAAATTGGVPVYLLRRRHLGEVGPDRLLAESAGNDPDG